MRAVIVGGGYLSQPLYDKAKELNWPVIPTFGCSECCSQIATGTIDDRRLKLLGHLQVMQGATLQLRGESLFTAYFDGELHDPKINGWFDTGDIVQLRDGFLIPFGRADEQVKIAGEKVHLGQLRQLLADISGEKGVSLEAVPDDRLGTQIHLIAERGINVESIIDAFNQKVPGYARIAQVRLVKALSRNEMGKITLQ